MATDCRKEVSMRVCVAGAATIVLLASGWGFGPPCHLGPAARLSTVDLQNEARCVIWDDLTDHRKKLSSGTQIVKELEQLFIAA